MIVTCNTRVGMGKPADPNSRRQRVMAECREFLARGEWPSLGQLRDVLPDIPDRTISHARWCLGRELGIVGMGERVVVDPARLP